MLKTLLFTLWWTIPLLIAFAEWTPSVKRRETASAASAEELAAERKRIYRAIGMPTDLSDLPPFAQLEPHS